MDSGGPIAQHTGRICCSDLIGELSTLRSEDKYRLSGIAAAALSAHSAFLDSLDYSNLPGRKL